MTELEEATATYVEFLWEQYGRCDIELVLPRPMFLGLLNDVRAAEPGVVLGYEYHRFTWNTPMGAVVVHMAPRTSTNDKVVSETQITDNKHNRRVQCARTERYLAAG
jgi:hypothetical protein